MDFSHNNVSAMLHFKNNQLNNIHKTTATYNLCQSKKYLFDFKFGTHLTFILVLMSSSAKKNKFELLTTTVKNSIRPGI